jgi:hypothetical protein
LPIPEKILGSVNARFRVLFSAVSAFLNPAAETSSGSK